MTVQAIVERHGNQREHLLAILHDLQAATPDNCLHRRDLQTLAEIMGLAVSDIVGSASFYTMFSFKPRGRHIIRLCESPPCYIMGEENIRRAIEAKLGVEMGETTPDGRFTLEYSSCLGACGVAPVMMIDDQVYGNLTEAKVDEILESMA
jgi:NADH-quinone oxidoreductase subunit E